MEGWGRVQLAAATATGNVTQIYPQWIQYAPGTTAGAAIPVAAGGLVRRPAGGKYGQIAVESDGTNGGVIQLFDINGLDALADVSSLNVITNTQLTTLIAAGKAKQIFEQNVAASPGAPIVWNWSQGFLRGLGARFVAAAGVCYLNVIGEGGFQFYITGGVYSGG